MPKGRVATVASESEGEVGMSRSMRMAGLLVLAVLVVAGPAVAVNGGYTLVGWNNLGMHCMDPDFSVFALLPPYNTIHAQLTDAQGRLVTSPGSITVTYQAVADPSGSINSTSQGKTNFWQFVAALFGASPAVDVGLAGKAMPGSSNTPQAMAFDTANGWFIAEGIPLTPVDDAGAHNAYPMMRLVARDAQGTVLASTDIVLPVSDEMNCSGCHATGGDPGAQPSAGWVNLSDPIRDYRLNILRLHDERRAGSLVFPAALAAAGYSASGLYATVVSGGKPVLCAACHASAALSAAGYAGVPALTRSIHTRHATVMDDATGMPLESLSNRQACYNCHPGSTTRCLRGAMGRAVAADGTMAMQCQSCHGTMMVVGAVSRSGWLDEPGCQSCHTGTATVNSGQIRYTSAYDGTGQRRVAANATFATNVDTPAAGLSLFRFSRGHGGVACEGCHGSTHAEFPSTHPSDNLQSVALQGHAGTIADCTACHNTEPTTVNGGPHGMHPVGQSWISAHRSAGGNEANCAPCHGADYRGTVLSRTFGSRSYQAGGTKTFWAGFQIGCYTCHRGPNDDDSTSNHAPQVVDATVSTARNVAVDIALTAVDADANPLTLWIVSQGGHGTVALAGRAARYLPETGFTGTDSFTFAAWDGSTSSNLGTVTIAVQAPTCSLDAEGPTSLTGTAGVAIQFSATVTTACPGTVAYDWDFGDGSDHSAEMSPSHVYAAAGTYTYTLLLAANGLTAAVTGQVAIAEAPPSYRYVLFLTHNPGSLGTSWSSDLAALNASSGSADATLTFHGPGGDISSSLTLASGAEAEWVDAVVSLFHLSQDAQGPVTVVSSAPLMITSRVGTPFSGGTVGQSFPAVAASDALQAGTDGFLPQLRSSASFRSNIGLVNASDVEAVVTVILHGPDGVALGKVLGVRVPAGGWKQLTNVFALAGVPSTPLGWARIKVFPAGAKIWAYASVIDNVTGDPATVIMQRP